MSRGRNAHRRARLPQYARPIDRHLAMVLADVPIRQRSRRHERSGKRRVRTARSPALRRPTERSGLARFGYYRSPTRRIAGSGHLTKRHGDALKQKGAGDRHHGELNARLSDPSRPLSSAHLIIPLFRTRVLCAFVEQFFRRASAIARRAACEIACGPAHSTAQPTDLERSMFLRRLFPVCVSLALVLAPAATIAAGAALLADARSTGAATRVADCGAPAALDDLLPQDCEQRR